MATRKYTNIYIPKYVCNYVNINGRVHVFILYIIPRLLHMSCDTTS